MDRIEEIDYDDYAEDGEFSSSKNKRLENSKVWEVNGNVYKPCNKSINNLPPAHYSINVDHSGNIFLEEKDIVIDELIVLPDSESENVIDSIKDFWSREEIFREHGFLWQRGVILYGPPGSGKTATIQLIIKNIIDTGGISVFLNHPKLAADGLRAIRKIEPTRPIVAIIEDIDSVIATYGEPNVLALLDGDLQIDNIVFIATTNYPEKLDKRIINRPSRFDIIKKIGMPNDAARKIFLQIRNKRFADGANEEDLDLWVSKTKDFSVAHLKELIISIEVLDHSFEESVERLRKMIDNKLSSDDDKQKIGFT